MKSIACMALLASTWCANAAWGAGVGPKADHRIREVTYDTGTVIHVPVKRGVSTHVELEPGEAIRFATAASNDTALGRTGCARTG